MATVTDWLTKQTRYTYDGAGRLSTTTYPNGGVATNTDDNADRLHSVTNTKSGTISSCTYTLDAGGNRTQVVANNGTTTFAYDNLYRLTSVTYPGSLGTKRALRWACGSAFRYSQPTRGGTASTSAPTSTSR